MKSDYEFMVWNEITGKLKSKYPSLTKSDLMWRHSNQEDVLEMIANKLGISYNDMMKEVNAL
ncbi:MAG: hypothetical protein JW798_00975 [Prolixibacteraceae bacterium]|nr:hypothetical protein [Prolixibacteraceae bacterium]